MGLDDTNADAIDSPVTDAAPVNKAALSMDKHDKGSDALVADMAAGATAEAVATVAKAAKKPADDSKKIADRRFKVVTDASRDALLTELVTDAYDDLAAALAQDGDLPRAYRAWALAQPHRYRLLFAAPLPGYDAHQPELVAAAQRSMDLLLEIEPDPQRAVTLWSRMHGHVSLEIEGNFASMGLDPEVLYAATIARSG